jgi:O-antigen/teichoic acid export membrane protein
VCRRDFPRAVARTAAFNISATVVAGAGGLIIARALGPVARGEYAAVTAWFGVALMVGGMGQPAALCFFVARDAPRAPEYVATSRAMMFVTGSVALCSGLLLAPILAHGHPALITGYRIAFAASIMAFVGASYTFSLQARNLYQWNIVRVTQPVLGFIGIAILWRLRVLTVDTALVVLSGTMVLQLAWAYGCCWRAALVPGHAQMALVRPLATYGAAQIAALTPAALNAQLDQLVLSQTVPPAELGRYAVAVSLSLFPIPLVSAIGNVAFPRLAAQSKMTQASRRLQKASVTGSFVISAGLIIPFAAVAYWIVPLVYGPAYREAVPLLWILAPGSVFFSSGQVVGDLLRGKGQPGVVAWAQGLAAVFTVVLLLALLPFVGVYGAAIASTIAYGVALAAMLRRLRHRPPRGGRRGTVEATPVVG